MEHYLRSTFLLDVVSSVPLSLILSSTNERGGCDDELNAFNGSLLPCDNGRTSWHNACTTRHEKMLCDGADFPGRAAAAFAEAYGGAVSMAAGTEDMANAYRTMSWVARP